MDNPQKTKIEMVAPRINMSITEVTCRRWQRYPMSMVLKTEKVLATDKRTVAETEERT